MAGHSPRAAVQCGATTVRLRDRRHYLWSKLPRPCSSSGNSARAAKSEDEPSAWLNSRTYDSRSKVSTPASLRYLNRWGSFVALPVSAGNGRADH